MMDWKYIEIKFFYVTKKHSVTVLECTAAVADKVHVWNGTFLEFQAEAFVVKL